MALAVVDAYPVPADRAAPSALRPTLVVGVATLAALTLALRLPVATTVVGLALFGIVHNVLELRYVSGRFAGVLAGRLLASLVVLVTGIVLCRLWPDGGITARRAEILLAYALLAVAWWWARGGVPRVRWWAGAPVLAVAVAASWRHPDHHFVMLAHLHNVVPLFFLWEWSRHWNTGRRAFRAVNVAWVVVVPVLVLAGAFDGMLRGAAARLGPLGTFTSGPLAATYTPPTWLDGAVALRFLTVFAFMQTMHYVVWVWLLPRHAPSATAAFDERVPALRGGRAVLAGVAGALLLGVLLISDYRTGRTLYGAVASYHAYLEFPVLLALLVGLAGRSLHADSARPTSPTSPTPPTLEEATDALVPADPR